MSNDRQHANDRDDAHDDAAPDGTAPEDAALFADLVAEAAQLPSLQPTRDLWDGIAARITTPVIAVDAVPPSVRPAWTRPGRLAAAAAVLVTVTATATWQIAQRTIAPPTASVVVADPVAPFAVAAPVVRLAGTYDQEISEMRALLAVRNLGLDTETTRVFEENLRVIDDAIAATRAALDADPASALLAQRLTGAYDMKLDLLRRLATLSEIS